MLVRIMEDIVKLSTRGNKDIDLIIDYYVDKNYIIKIDNKTVKIKSAGIDAAEKRTT